MILLCDHIIVLYVEKEFVKFQNIWMILKIEVKEYLIVNNNFKILTESSVFLHLTIFLKNITSFFKISISLNKLLSCSEFLNAALLIVFIALYCPVDLCLTF
jgi:hypothetical protein